MTAQLWVYTFSWNEEKIIPYFLRHYFEHVKADKIIVHDNESTDATRHICNSYPGNVEVRTYSSGGTHSEVAHMVPIRNRCHEEAWRAGVAWLAVVDCDEFLFHNDFAGCLSRCDASGEINFYPSAGLLHGDGGLPDGLQCSPHGQRALRRTM
jgi:glycosyltransferase involved in cell wall biosynthesis